MFTSEQSCNVFPVMPYCRGMHSLSSFNLFATTFDSCSICCIVASTSATDCYWAKLWCNLSILCCDYFTLQHCHKVQTILLVAQCTLTLDSFNSVVPAAWLQKYLQWFKWYYPYSRNWTCLSKTKVCVYHATIWNVSFKHWLVLLSWK